MALNTDYAMRTGAFEPEKGLIESGTEDNVQKVALERYNLAKVRFIPAYLLTEIYHYP